MLSELLNSHMLIRSRRAIGALVLSGFAISGCGGDAETTTVRGKVSFNGESVTRGVINFQAQGRRPLGGPIGPEGSYSFELPPGRYNVRIDSPPPIPEGYKEGDPLPQLEPRQVPEMYASFNTSGLTATVNENGPQTIDFVLP